MHLRGTASRATALLSKNPSLFCRLLLAKLNTARPMPTLPVRRSIGNVVFEYDLGHYRGTAPMYFGSYAMLIVDAMKRFLRPGDVFLDVGANIGYLSAVGADLVGTRGQVHAFEPVPAYAHKLRRLAERNPAYSIFPNACAAGETSGKLICHVTREAGQNTLVPAYKNAGEIVATTDVPVVRLDDYLETCGIERVGLIKIDAEGFELPVLKGLQHWFERCSGRPPIICEIAPRAYPLMRRSVRELAEYMAEYDYAARDLIDGSTPVDVRSINNVEDVLFVARQVVR